MRIKKIKIKHKKAKAKLVGWTILSAVVMTFLITIMTAKVDPSSFDSKKIGNVLGLEFVTSEKEEQTILYDVERVVDGDTLEVITENGVKKVRLLGIDAPESKHPQKSVECFGIESSDRLKNLLTDQQVMLELDITQANVDRYGRLIRYVFLPDGTNVNELLLREGFAHEYTYDSKPYLLQEDFIKAEQEARIYQRGLWGSDKCN